MLKETQKGLAFIDYVIFTVIICLAAGIYIIGKDYLVAAKVRSTMAQISTYDVAITSFFNKFNALPGDMRFATSYGLGENGNGNFYLEIDPISLENLSMWQHLSKSGFVSEQYVASSRRFGEGAPKTFIENVGVYVSSSPVKIVEPGFYARTNYYILGLSEQNVDFYTLTSQAAEMMDTKRDDGFPTTGEVLGDTTSNPDCILMDGTSSSRWRSTNEDTRCRIAIEFKLGSRQSLVNMAPVATENY